MIDLSKAEVSDTERQHLDEVRAEALAWAQGQRERVELEPIEDFEPGDVTSPWSCPMAKAIGGAAYYDAARVGDEMARIAYPTAVAEFVAYVTMGLYPDLKQEEHDAD